MHSHEVIIPRRNLFEHCVRKVQVQEGLVVAEFEIYCHLNGVSKCIRRSIRHSPRESISNHTTRMWEDIVGGAELTAVLDDDGRTFHMFTPSEYSKISRRFKSWEFSGYFSAILIRGQLQDQQIVDVEAAVLYGDIPLALLPQYIAASMFGGVIPSDCLYHVPSCKIKSVDSNKVRGVVRLGVSNVRDDNIANVSATKLVGSIGDLHLDVSNFGGQASVDQLPDGAFRLDTVDVARTHGRLTDIGVCDKAIDSHHIHDVDADLLTGFIPSGCLHKLTDRCIESVHGKTIKGNLFCTSSASQTLQAMGSKCRELVTDTLELDNGVVERYIKSEMFDCGVLECNRVSSLLRLDASHMWMASAKVGSLQCQILKCQSVSSDAISIVNVGNIRNCLVGHVILGDAEALDSIMKTVTVEKLNMQGEACACNMNSDGVYSDGVRVEDSCYTHNVISPSMRAASLASNVMISDNIASPYIHCEHISCDTSCIDSLHLSKDGYVDVLDCSQVSCDSEEVANVVCNSVTAIDFTGGSMLVSNCLIDAILCDELTCETADVLGRLHVSSESMEIWKYIVSLDRRLEALEGVVT